MKAPLRLIRLCRKATAMLALWDQGLANWDARRASQPPALWTSPAWVSRFVQAARDLALEVGVPKEMEDMLMKNWKTTLAGVSTILAIVAKVVSTGNVDWQIDGPAIITAIGLIVAKDGEKVAK